MRIARATTDYHDVRNELDSGDLMVLNRSGLIARHTRGTASHVGLLVLREADQRSLAVAESREGKGGRVVSLSSQVRKYPGMIDVYTPVGGCSLALRQRAATVAFNWSGRAYDYPGILRRSLVHSPLLYELVHALGYEPDLSDLTPSPWDEPKVCSGLVAFAYRWSQLELAGKSTLPDFMKHDFLLTQQWNVCPALGDRWVEPNDLVRGGAFALRAKGLVIDE